MLKIILSLSYNVSHKRVPPFGNSLEQYVNCNESNSA